MDRYLSDLQHEYSTNRTLRTVALLESGEKPTGLFPQYRNSWKFKLLKDAREYMARGKYGMRGSYDNGIYYSRRFRVTNTYHEGLARIITLKLNRMFKRRLRQRMSPVKAKRSGTEVHIFVARGNWESLEKLLPSIYHTTNIIYKYFEKGCNFK